jgi:type II secretory pathway component PulM
LQAKDGMRVESAHIVAGDAPGVVRVEAVLAGG